MPGIELPMSLKKASHLEHGFPSVKCVGYFARVWKTLRKARSKLSLRSRLDQNHWDAMKQRGLSPKIFKIRRQKKSFQILLLETVNKNAICSKRLGTANFPGLTGS